MKTLGWILGVFVTASCGFPRPADVGPDDATGNADCQLTAIGPSIASPDDTITLEGTFGDAVMVNFPGGTSVPATVLGPHRASATVPASATAGDLTVTTCGSRVGPLAFRRVTFTPGVGMFEGSFDQADGAQQTVSLAIARDGHTSVVVGRYLYVLGGVGSNGPLGSVEQASLNADGSLGPFANVFGAGLMTARQAHTTAVIGNYLYVVGGFGSSSPLNSVERAMIGPAGTLGPFVTLSEVTLTIARQGHTSAVIGNYLYILGGLGNNSLNSIERAIINADGSLGPFSIVPDTTLATARYGHTSAVIGNYLYVLGGARGNGSMQDVERATINADGSLGPFASVPGAMLMAARAGHTAEVIGSYLYVLGGAGSNGSLNSVERAPLDAVGSLGSFTTVPGVTLTAARHGHSTAVIGNYLYALGGIGTGSLNSVERATINISGSLGPLAISSSTTLTTARGGQATVVVGNYLYVLGGYANGGLNSVERASIDADGSLGQLTTVSSVTLAAARYNHTAAVVGNSVYVLGGLANSVTLNSVERAIIAADGSLGAFAPVAGITMRSARNSHTAAVVGNYLYVLGGSNGNVVLDNVERAPIAPDGSLGPFESAPNGPLMTARVYHTTAVIGNYLYVIGGFGNNGLSNIERASIAADGSLGPFAPVSGVALTTARYDHVTAVVGNYLYVLGGGGDVTPLSSVERATLGADGSLGSFAPVASLTLATARVQHTAVIVRNYLYVLGGSDLKGYLNSVERATLSAEGPH